MREHFTILFNTFVLMNLFNQVACRKLGWADFKIHRNFFNNFWFLIVLFGEFVAQWFIVQVFNTIFRTAPLTWPMHITCYIFGAGTLAVHFLGKIIFDDKEVFRKVFDLNFNETNEAGKSKFFD